MNNNVLVKGFVNDEKLNFRIKIVGPVSEEEIQKSITKYFLGSFLRNDDLLNAYKTYYCKDIQFDTEEIILSKPFWSQVINSITEPEWKWNYFTI